MREFINRISPILCAMWEFAKEKTALFLSLCTAAISLTTILLNLFEYCYNLGYYHYSYGIPITFLKYSGLTTLSGSICLSIVVLCFLILYTLAARDTYRNCKYLNFLLGTYFIITCFFIIPIIKDTANNFSVMNLIIVLLQYVFLAAFLTVALNVFFFAFCIVPTNEKTACCVSIAISYPSGVTSARVR